ncbi:winged helix-turn-helix transcriptional regulator [Halovulum dunhuangense]|uniref:Winged helix-turn-helix transcriptional regulator n=1 Tax=Halovulum dunhuangense TaxID=1505036 RepID=A0A849L704_9RHOB|nr:winged helix-turn-helix transcriptional regulator [Halovulum dunhuangense]
MANSDLPATVSPSPIEGPTLHLENWTIDLNERVVFDTGKNVVHLTPSEFDLLKYFLRNAGRVVSRAEIVAAIRDGRSVADLRIVDGLVVRLRRKLVRPDGTPIPIRSVRGSGYVLTMKGFR